MRITAAQKALLDWARAYEENWARSQNVLRDGQKILEEKFNYLQATVAGLASETEKLRKTNVMNLTRLFDRVDDLRETKNKALFKLFKQNERLRRKRAHLHKKKAV